MANCRQKNNSAIAQFFLFLIRQRFKFMYIYTCQPTNTPMNPSLAPFTFRRLPQTRRAARSFAVQHGLVHAIMRCPREPHHRQVKLTCNKFISPDEWHAILRKSSSINAAIASACDFGQQLANANRMLTAAWDAHEAGNGIMQVRLEENSNDAWQKAQSLVNHGN